MNKFPRRKAATGAIRSDFLNQNKNFAGGKNQRFDVSNYIQIMGLRQCKVCGSDDLRFAVNDTCLRCQQRVEFIMREHPNVWRQIQNQKRGVQV